MILSQLLPDNLPIVNNAIGENLGFVYENLAHQAGHVLNSKASSKKNGNTFYKLIYVMKGEAVLEHASQKNVIRDRPFIYFSAPGRAQKISVSGNVEGHALLISKEILLDILNKLPDSVMSYRDDAFILDLSLKREVDAEIAILQNAFENIQEEVHKEESLGLRALLLCWIRLAYITAFRLSHQGAALFLSHHRHAKQFRKYLHLIDENYKDHWALPTYAMKLNITVSTLNNICKELGGLSAKEYVSQRLMKEAEFMLKYTALTIIEIAHQLGFKDSSYFSRFFRRYAEISPRDYRQNLGCSPSHNSYL